MGSYSNSNSDKVTELTSIIEIQREKLKLCRDVMRNKGIGQLYPIESGDFRKKLREFAKSKESSKNVFFEQLASDERVQVSILLEFIQEKGLTPEELERFLRKKDIKRNNPQTENSLSDESLSRG